MAKAKTFRLRSDQADWLAKVTAESGLRSENQVLGIMIDEAMGVAWAPTVRVDRGGWISGPSKDVP